MESRGLMTHTQEISNNPYPEPNQLNSSHLRLDLPKGLFPVGIHVKILEVFLHFSILTTNAH